MRYLVAAILCVFLFSCNKDEINPDNPKWLTELISDIEKDNYYAGSVILRYKWEGDFYYLLEIPLSSCVLCELYDYKGTKPGVKEDEIDDFLITRSNETLIWADPLVQ